MKNSIFSKLILIKILLFNFTLQVNSEIIPITFGNSSKHLPTSTKSKVSGKDDGTLMCWLASSNMGSIHIQKIDMDGQLQWGEEGIVIDTELGLSFDPDSDYPMIYSDNLGGALVIYGKDFYSSREIYVAKIYFNGIPSRSPVCISSHTGGYNFSATSALTNDNSIDASWENFDDGDFNIYAQKINLDGDVLWNDGEEVAVCRESHDQRKPTITCDGSNNVVIAWLDDRNSYDKPEFGFDLYANRLDKDGNYTHFSNKGKLIFSYYDEQQRISFDKTSNIKKLNSINSDNERKVIFYNHNLVSSDNNSVIVAIDKWYLDVDSDIKIFKINEDLDFVWDFNIQARSFQKKPLIASNNNNGAYIFWNDSRNEENAIYGIGLDSYGRIIMGQEGGIKISCDKRKDSFERILPSHMNQSGIYSGKSKIHFSWTTLENNNLYVSGINLFSRTEVCKSAVEIQDNIANGEVTSISTQNEDVVVIFKMNNNIFISMALRDKSNDLTNKISINNFPNPFNPITKISFNIPKSGHVELAVYDISGREIESLVNEFKTAGSYSVNFDGGLLSSGVYFYRIEMNGWIETKRMTLIK